VGEKHVTSRLPGFQYKRSPPPVTSAYLNNGLEREDTGLCLDSLKGLTVLILESTVTIPAPKDVMEHEENTSGQYYRVAHPQGVS